MVSDPKEQIAVEAIQNEISLGGDNDALEHLGEAVSIHLLATAGAGRLISDDGDGWGSGANGRVPLSWETWLRQ